MSWANSQEGLMKFWDSHVIPETVFYNDLLQPLISILSYSTDQITPTVLGVEKLNASLHSILHCISQLVSVVHWQDTFRYVIARVRASEIIILLPFYLSAKKCKKYINNFLSKFDAVDAVRSHRMK